MTQPYSPDTAVVVATGTTSSGFVDSSGVAWDGALMYYNLAVQEARAAALALDRRDAAADMRGRLRQLTATTPPVVNVLTVGDSLTVGTGSSDGTGYRGWLVDLADRRNVALHIASVAVGGATLRDMTPQVPPALAAQVPDIALLEFGYNDAAQPDMTDYANRYAALIATVLASSPTVRVACALVPIPRPAVGLWTAQVPAVNTAITSAVASFAATGRVAAVDVRAAMPTAWTGSDGIHPLDAGYLRWAQTWMTTIGPWLPVVP